MQNQNQNQSLNEIKFFDNDIEQELKPTYRRANNRSMRDGLKPLNNELIRKLTSDYYKHREYMNKKYGDDPKYFIFTRQNINKNQFNDKFNKGLGRGLVLNHVDNNNKNENFLQREKNDDIVVNDIIEKIENLTVKSISHNIDNENKNKSYINETNNKNENVYETNCQNNATKITYKNNSNEIMPTKPIEIIHPQQNHYKSQLINNNNFNSYNQPYISFSAPIFYQYPLLVRYNSYCTIETFTPNPAYNYNQLLRSHNQNQVNYNNSFSKNKF